MRSRRWLGFLRMSLLEMTKAESLAISYFMLGDAHNRSTKSVKFQDRISEVFFALFRVVSRYVFLSDRETARSNAKASY